MSGDGLTITGGANGLAARFDDLHAQANLLDLIAGDLGEVASTLASLAVSPDIAEAALLCPLEAAQAEEAVLAANLGSHGVAVGWARAEASVAFVRFAIAAYQEVDDWMRRAGDELAFSGGFVAGSAAVPALVGGVVSNPLLAASLWATRGRLAEAAQNVAYDQPWTQEVAARAAPGFVEGAFSLLLGGNSVLLRLVSGGHWPTSDLEGAVQGLLHVGGRAGLLEDAGGLSVAAVGPPSRVEFTNRHFVEEAIRQQDVVDDEDARVRVVAVEGPAGRSYVVQIPGTQSWAPSRGDNPFDLTSNTHLVAGHHTQLAAAVVAAMHEAGVPASAPILMTGHSQGGIVAAAIAADPEYRRKFNIKAVITAGSPIGIVPIPPDVSVLSLEHRQDLVPKLDGADNPDRPNWVTITRDLHDGAPPNSEPSILAAHSLDNYARTGSEVDGSGDPSVVRWRAILSGFSGVGSAQSYRVLPVGGH
jgi:hypothetical protein